MRRASGDRKKPGLCSPGVYSVSGGSDAADVIVGHVAGFAGLQVDDLAPDLSFGNHLQLVAGVQAADRPGGLVGGDAEADAAVALVVQGLRSVRVGAFALTVYGFGTVMKLSSRSVISNLPGLLATRNLDCT